MELNVAARRLTGVGWLLGLVIALAAVPATAQAQSAAPYRIEATIGVEGWVAPTFPATLTFRVESDVLLVGDVQVRQGGTNFLVPVEVPAGGEKEYSALVPGAGVNGALSVQVIPRDGDPGEIERVRVLRPDDEQLLVGVYGGPDIVQTLGRLRTQPLGKIVNPVSLNGLASGADLNVLGYVVIGSHAPDVTAGPDADALLGFVARGGRLVASPAVISSLAPATASLQPIGATGAGLVRSGAGELISFSLTAGADDWVDILRDMPIGSTGESGAVEFRLIEATGSASAQLPGIPWLLGALFAYVVIVGPLNFIVLGRLGRPDWAWLTVPMISVVAVAGFWVFGRQQISSIDIRHATVVAQYGGTTTAASGIALAGGGRDHVVDLPAGWVGYSLGGRFAPGQSAPMTVRQGAEGTTIELETAGREVASLGALWDPGRINVTGRLVGDDIQVTNNSGLTFWGWGVGVGPIVAAGPGSFSDGDEATLGIGANFQSDPFSPPIADVVLRRQIGDHDWQTVYPLAGAAGSIAPQVFASEPYFFGYTDDFRPSVRVDGDRADLRGPSLVVIALEGGDTLSASRRRVAPEILDVVGGENQVFQDEFGGSAVVYGAEEIVLRYVVPTGAPDILRISTAPNGFGSQPETADAYDWVRDEWVAVDWPSSVDGAQYRSPGDEVLLRLMFRFQDEVFPSTFVLTWVPS